MSSQREAALRRFHARRPGATAAALARAASYQRLAAGFAPGERVLDLACGDGHLTGLLAARGCIATGIDLSAAELALAAARDSTGAWVCARAQQLPLADRSFDGVACHLALMLFDDIPAVVAELARVLVPRGRILAVLGGGPVATGDDAFHHFLALAQPHLTDAPQLGNPVLRGEAGWATAFAAWTELHYERWELDLAGTADQLWQFFGASYELAAIAPAAVAALEAETRAAIEPLGDAAGIIPCRLALYCAGATRSP